MKAWLARRDFRKLAIVTAVLTFVQLIMGGVVHGTGSSLACPDWPLCFGEVFPEMVGGVLYEHSHRYMGTLLGILSIGLLLVAWAQAAAQPIRLRLGWLTFVAVCVQGVLGGLTVIFKLPTLVSTAHLALSMAFFLLLILLVHRESDRPAAPTSVTLHRWIKISTVAVYLQIVLGALVRHTGAGTACYTDLPLCRGTLWPAQAIAQAHMLHRIVGVVAGALVMVVAVLVFRAAASPAVRRLAAAAPFLVLVQVTLGVLSVATLLGLAPVTAHLAVGALLLANLWLLWLGTRPVRLVTSAATADVTTRRAVIS